MQNCYYFDLKFILYSEFAYKILNIFKIVNYIKYILQIEKSLKSFELII